MLKINHEEEEQYKKDRYLLITRDQSLFDASSPTAQFIADIGQAVPELHIIYIGPGKQVTQKLADNIFVYTAKPFFGFEQWGVNRLLSRELIWRGNLQIKVVVSIGDEIKRAQWIAKKYDRPLVVFYSYLKVLGRDSVKVKSLVKAKPKNIFVPSAYVGAAIEKCKGYLKEMKIVILPQFVDIDKLKSALDAERLDEVIAERNKIFTMILFPQKIDLQFARMIKQIAQLVSLSVRRFQFYVVLKKKQIAWARLLRSLFSLSFEIFEEQADSSRLFSQARLMLYFDHPGVSYEPILYSLTAGCPVISTGDEYSKIILFNSELEEFTHIAKTPQAFAEAIKKLINDPYLYSTYKANCADFTKSSFSQDRDAYVSLLRANLNTNNISA